MTWGALIADYLCRGEGCEKCPNELVCDAMIQTIILLGKLRLRKVI